MLEIFQENMASYGPEDIVSYFIMLSWLIMQEYLTNLY
jgi:hypothetical protein